MIPDAIQNKTIAMTSNAIPRQQLFTASRLALRHSLSFGIRAGILGKLGTEFHLNGSEL
jgi:hypothetical protein